MDNTTGLNAGHMLTDALRRHVELLQGVGDDYDAIVQAAQGNAPGSVRAKKFVLIGEATHGTAEFYRIRAEITRRLIVEEGFDAIAVEADWPDAYRVNRYVSNQPDDTEAGAALSDFERFPTWMWRNTEVQDFVEWLRDTMVGAGDIRGERAKWARRARWAK